MAMTESDTAQRRRPDASTFVIGAGESPWTENEIEEVVHVLTADRERLTAELDEAEREFADLIIDTSDGAGFDQADIGTSSMERDQEISVAANARDMLVQIEHAVERITNGTYGVCESCGQPIGKARLMAFPRATLCLPCKQREERR
jgi:DnaK suppressor protein